MPAKAAPAARRAAPSVPTRFVALLRGVNVGGKNKLPMAALVEICEAAGARDVTTFIQSGNALFRADAAEAAALAPRIAAGIEARFGFRAPVVLRSADELRAVVENNPYAADDLDIVHVAFLAGAPSAAQAASLDPNRSPPDEFTLRGRELYLRLPNGVARTKLTNAWLDAKLGTVSTVRNWRTVCKFVALLTS